MDADVFLRAVCDDPDEIAPRLVFADWLEEQGDPRAEFIRVQIEYSQLDEEDARRYDCLRRERELLESYRELWAGWLRGIPLDCWIFRRGFVEDVTISTEALLKHADSLFSRTPVRRLKLLRPSGYISELAKCHWLSQVRQLDLSRGGLRDDNIGPLLESDYLANLTWLDLSSNSLGERSLTKLQSSPMSRLKLLRLESIFQWRFLDETDEQWTRRYKHWQNLIAILERRYGLGVVQS